MRSVCGIACLMSFKKAIQPSDAAKNTSDAIYAQRVSRTKLYYIYIAVDL